jgi:hypothetical protein
MGIRFACHVCEKKLNVKRDLAGRRGVCPACTTRFRIPSEDAERSFPIDESTVGVQTESRAESTVGVQAETQAVPLVADRPAIPSAAKATDNPATPHMVGSAVKSSGNGREDVFEDPTDSGVTSLLDEDPAATWYVRPPSGGQYGPASSEILKQWIDEGRVASTALLWRDGWPQWREASETLPELAGRFPNGNVASRVQSSGAPVKHTPSTPVLSGQSSAGDERRSRSGHRVLLIGVLTALALTLIGVLVIVVSR